MNNERHIIIYSSSECPRCKLVKQMLDKHHVQYEEILDNTQLMINKGFEAVPVIEVDDEVIDEYINILTWLEKHNYYSL